MRSITKAAIAAGAALALVVLGAPLAASAHTPSASLDCATATVTLTNYDKAATATVVLDGTTLHAGTFGGHLVTSYPTGGGNTEHHLIVQVKSFDNLNDQGASPYDYQLDTTTTTCYVAPPKAEVTGSVSFADGSCIDNVRVGNSAQVAVVDGVRYSYTVDGGAVNPLPSQSYDESGITPGTYVVTAVANDPAHFVYVGTATWSHTFTAVPTECAPPVVVVPEQPADIVTATSSEATKCDAKTVTTTTVTTTTGSAYNEATNTWVRTAPVDVTTTATRDATAEECPVVVPPVVVPPTEPPVVVPPVVVPPTELPVVVPPTELLTTPATPTVPAASVERLAYTGADASVLTFAGGVGLMLLAGGIITVLAARRRARTE